MRVPKLVKALCWVLAFVAISRSILNIGSVKEGELYDETWNSAVAIERVSRVPSLTFQTEYVSLQHTIYLVQNLLWFMKADNYVNSDGDNVRQWQEWEFVSSDFVQPEGDPGRVVDIVAPDGTVVEKVWLVGRVQVFTNFFQTFGQYFSWLVSIVFDLASVLIGFLNLPIDFLTYFIWALMLGFWQPEYLPDDWLPVYPS